MHLCTTHRSETSDILLGFITGVIEARDKDISHGSKLVNCLFVRLKQHISDHDTARKRSLFNHDLQQWVSI